MPKMGASTNPPVPQAAEVEQQRERGRKRAVQKSTTPTAEGPEGVTPTRRRSEKEFPQLQGQSGVENKTGSRAGQGKNVAVKNDQNKGKKNCASAGKSRIVGWWDRPKSSSESAT